MRRFGRHLRNLIRVQPGRPAFALGLRAAVAVTIPSLLLSLAGLQQAGWAGLTGLLVTLADRGGSYQVRARVMGTVTALGAVVGGLATSSGGGSLWAEAGLLLAGVGISTFVRSYSETAGMIGGQMAVIFVASLGAPAVGLEGAVERGACLFLGGAWSMLQALVLWPLRPYRPARKGVASVYDALADAADDLARFTRSCPGPEKWAAATARHGSIALKIEDARERLAAVRVGRADESRRGHHLLVLLEMTEPTVGMLLALSTATEVVCADPAMGAARRKIARTCEAYAVRARRVAAVTRDPSRRRRPSSPLRFPDRPLQQMPVAVAELLRKLRDYIRVGTATAEAMAHGRPSPVDTPTRPWTPSRPGLLAPLRANLTPDSLVLRHAVRSGVVATCALLVTRALGLGQVHWVVLSAIGILQPYAGGTEERALQRGLGTVFGGLLAAALAGGIENRMVLLLVIGVLTAISVSLLPLNFGAFQILLTPDLLLLATLHTGDWSIALNRAIGVTIAAVLAVCGVWFLWPTSERKRFPDAAASALRADSRYLRLVAASGSATDDAVNLARREFGLAMLEAEASFERLMTEFRGPAQKLEPAMTLLAYARRLAAAVTALREQPSADSTPLATSELAQEAGGALDALADSLREGRLPPTLPPLPSQWETADPVSGQLIERVPRQLQILSGAVARLAEERVLLRT